MEPVRGGKLADVPKDVEALFKKNKPEDSIASWAIKFVASYPNVMTILSGMNSTEQMLDNLASLTDFEPMSSTELKICANAASIINDKQIIPCTGCDYCADCPKKVKISSIFATYNDFQNGVKTKEECIDAYSKIDVKHNSCVACGKCAGHCPQSIKIPDLLNSTIKDFFA